MKLSRKKAEQLRKAVQDALVAEFQSLFAPENDTEGYYRKALDRDVYVQADAPGQWAPNAELEIYTEQGIPGMDYGYDAYTGVKGWNGVSSRLQEAGWPYYAEFINGAVVAIYHV